MPYGHDDGAWESAKSEAKGILRDRASGPDFLISYSDLCSLIQTIDFEPHDPVFWQFLGDISTDEYRQGRGMLTAIVVHKVGEHRPGSGFQECAASLGLDTSDPDRIWTEQLNFVLAHWSNSVEGLG